MFLIGDKRFRDYDLTNAGNRGLQVTPCRNYGSGLPKEAHRDKAIFVPIENGLFWAIYTR